MEASEVWGWKSSYLNDLFCRNLENTLKNTDSGDMACEVSEGRLRIPQKLLGQLM